MFGSLGVTELVIIGVIMALIFGPSRLPKLARGLGESLKEFKKVGKDLEDIRDDKE